MIGNTGHLFDNIKDVKMLCWNQNCCNILL